MKIHPPLCAAVLCGVIQLFVGQNPAAASQAHSLSLSVEPLSTGGASNVKESLDSKRQNVLYSGNTRLRINTAQTQNTSQSSSIQISVHNLGHLMDTVQIEWYFVASPKSSGGPQFIFDQGSRSASLAANDTLTLPVTSTAITSTVQRQDSAYARGGKQRAKRPKESGSTLGGWIVRLVADGQVLDASGSKQELEDIARDSAKFAALKQQKQK